MTDLTLLDIITEYIMSHLELGEYSLNLGNECFITFWKTKEWISYIWWDFYWWSFGGNLPLEKDKREPKEIIESILDGLKLWTSEWISERPKDFPVWNMFWTLC